LDAKIANEIFNALSTSHLLKRKTIILATNNQAYCRRSDRTVLIENGSVIGMEFAYQILPFR